MDQKQAPHPNFQPISALLAKRQPKIQKKQKRVYQKKVDPQTEYMREFQVFGDRLTRELRDEKRRGLYMKLAKHESRGLLEQALYFVKDSKARNPAALFMWKLKQLKNRPLAHPKGTQKGEKSM